MLAVGLAAAIGGPCRAQDPLQSDAGSPAAADESNLETVEAQIASLEPAEQAGTLDEEGALRLQLYREALASLTEADQAAQQRTRLAGELAQVPGELESVKTELAGSPEEPKPDPPAGATLAELQQSLEKVQADLEAARNRLREIESESQRRDARRTEIAEQIAAAEQRLQEIDQQLSALPLAGESPAVTNARRTRLAAERRLLRNRIDLLELERRNYDARRELLPLRRERWARRVNQFEKLASAWQAIVDTERARDVRRQQREAARQATAAHPLVAPIAESNLELAQRRDELLPASEQAQQRLDELTPDPETLDRQLQRLGEKVDAVGLTSTVGLLLRKERAALPDTGAHRRAIRQRRARMADVEFERLQREDEYDALVLDSDRIIAEKLAELDPSTPAEQRDLIEQELREQLRLKREYLQSLNNDLTVYFNRLQDLNEKQLRIVESTEKIAAYIDERILWIKSAKRLGPADFKDAMRAATWLVDADEWKAIGERFRSDLRTQWLAFVAALAGLGALLALRGRMRTRIKQIAAEIARPTTDTFGRTLLVLLYTVARAAAWPAAMWLAAFWLGRNGRTGDLASSLAAGLNMAAVLLLVYRLIGEVCRPKGLGEAHFRWPAARTAVVRRHLTWVTAVTVPGVFVVELTYATTQESHETSLGRLAFVVVMAAISLAAYRLLRPTGGIVVDYLRRNRGRWIDRLRFVWYPLAVLLPLALAVQSCLGFHYTALRLSIHLLQTVGFVLIVMVLNGLLTRWLVVAQRRLAREEARKRRAELEQKRAAGEAPPGEAPQVDEPRVDISAIGAQTRQLVRGLVIFTLLVGFWTIWDNALPALGFLEKVELWLGPSGPVDAAAGADAAMPEMVTLEDVLRAVIALVVTLIVGKNIPGLLEISILQRLPLAAGSRYAITTLMRYAITIAGIVIAFRFIGVTWSKVQWIAAAVTVGLGFGLQEIFGNFVSGLIILFERPIRVGDTVTVGDINGTITSIRIRSTTVVDWDRKELVVPNKDFVTGRIINWTLSDPVLRVVIPVGIAYGSDTALAETLLMKAARGHPIVLKEPPPRVVFERFGDSSLEFSLRVFIPHIDQLLNVRHEMHNAIDREFRKAGIEIAFPQRDIHVRSISGELPIEMPDQRSAISDQ